MNEWEQQMRSWRPRRPSTTLKARIFGVEHPAHTARWLWGSLAPAMACVLLTLMTVNQNGSGFGHRTKMKPGPGIHNNAYFTPELSLSAQNELTGTITFGWTNRSVFNSSIGFTSSTN